MGFTGSHFSSSLTMEFVKNWPDNVLKAGWISDIEAARMKAGTMVLFGSMLNGSRRVDSFRFLDRVVMRDLTRELIVLEVEDLSVLIMYFIKVSAAI